MCAAIKRTRMHFARGTSVIVVGEPTEQYPVTARREVAVHKGFRVLDMVAHILTAVTITDPATVHVVDPASLPNPNWLKPGIPGAGQQDHGNQLLSAHKFVAIPSAVSVHSWNLIFVPATASGASQLGRPVTFAPGAPLHPP